jgi:hypothetical protein
MRMAPKGSRLRRGRPRSAAIVAALTSIAALGFATPAVAGLNKEFSVFDDCPVTHPGLVGCVVSYTTGGEFVLGSKTVPITKTITLQGGLEGGSNVLVPAEGGETLSRTPLQVPGGLAGIELLPPLTEVNATSELAGSVALNAGNLFGEPGTAVTMPLKARLENAALGSECYVGSNTEPILLHLTTGTTKPPAGTEAISGKVAKVEFLGNGNIARGNGAVLVDNTFPVPGANGCDGALSAVVDPAVDLSSGLPAEAGKNKAVLDTSVESVSSALVIAQRELPLFGRCTKSELDKEKGNRHYTGSYLDSGCTAPEPNGEYEWAAGPGSNASFSASGGSATLELAAGGGAVSCKQTTLDGGYTGEKTASAKLTLSGCALAHKGASCQSAGAASGEIVSDSLGGELGFVKDATEEGHLVAQAGLDLKAPTILAAECGSTKLTVTGSVIGVLGTVDKTSATNTLTFSQSGGAQAPEAFEEGAKDTLLGQLGSAAAASAGLNAKLKITSAEPIEVKAVAN